MSNKHEILINSSVVTNNECADAYEFVLNESLQVVECVKIDVKENNQIKPILNAIEELDGLLFELNHVRVNPRVDNTYIINCLTNALYDIGVQVENTPNSDSMAVCFRPLGEISDNVRFYFGLQNKIIFLSPAANKLKLISSNNRL